MTLMRMLKQIKKELSTIKLIFLGLDNAGKTTLIYKIFNDDIKNIAPTFGYHIYTKQYNGANLIIHDIGGQKCLRKYWSNFYEKTDGVLFVFDIADNRGFDEALNNILSECGNTPIVIYANKMDLCDGDVNIGFKNNMHVVKCSAKTGENVEKGIEWLIGKIRENDLRI